VRIFFGLALFVILTGCTSIPSVDGFKPPDNEAAFQQRALMVGKWFGDSPTKDGGRKMYILERFLDGTMKIRFRLIDANGSVEEQTELAQWGVSGNVYFTITHGILDGEDFHPFDPRQPYFNDAYEILELTEEVLQYRHAATGNEYKIKRVADNFDFP